VLNPSSSQPTWLQNMQTGMDQVSRAAASLRDAPARADRRNSQERLQRQIELVQQQGATLLALARQSGLDGVELAQAQQPIVQAQADDIARRSNANADQDLDRTIQLNTNNAGLVQATQTNAGKVTEGILDTTGRNLREGVQTQSRAYASEIFPGVKELAQMGIDANAANTQAFIGGPDGQSALQQLIAYQREADQANTQAFNRANPAWAPVADTGLRFAGILGAALI
jgi:hypothetical protein